MVWCGVYYTLAISIIGPESILELGTSFTRHTLQQMGTQSQVLHLQIPFLPFLKLL
jgi:hypothetical protein